MSCVVDAVDSRLLRPRERFRDPPTWSPRTAAPHRRRRPRAGSRCHRGGLCTTGFVLGYTPQALAFPEPAFRFSQCTFIRFAGRFALGPFQADEEPYAKVHITLAIIMPPLVCTALRVCLPNGKPIRHPLRDFHRKTGRRRAGEQRGEALGGDEQREKFELAADNAKIGSCRAEGRLQRSKGKGRRYWRGQVLRQLRTCSPGIRWKWPTFPVIKMRRCTMAVAAIRISASLTSSPCL